MNINIQFCPDGSAHYLWTDAVPLHELGRLEIHRATNIEFNNTTQKWEVRDRRGKVRFIARSNKIQVLKDFTPTQRHVAAWCNRFMNRAALKEQLVGRCGNAAYSSPGARRIRLHLCLDWREQISRRQGKIPRSLNHHAHIRTDTPTPNLMMTQVR
jgi:hypothetical protein